MLNAIWELSKILAALLCFLFGDLLIIKSPAKFFYAPVLYLHNGPSNEPSDAWETALKSESHIESAEVCHEREAHYNIGHNVSQPIL